MKSIDPVFARVPASLQEHAEDAMANQGVSQIPLPDEIQETRQPSNH
jgi:hypothetical protein